MRANKCSYVADNAAVCPGWRSPCNAAEYAGAEPTTQEQVGNMMSKVLGLLAVGLLAGPIFATVPDPGTLVLLGLLLIGLGLTLHKAA